MSKGNILSLDCGYGMMKYCIVDPNSGRIIKMDKEVSGVLEIPEGDSSIISNVDTYHKFNGKRYLIGELSSKLDLTPIDIMEYEGFKLASPILMSYLLKKFSTNNIGKLSIGITPAIWDKREDYLSYVKDMLGLDNIELHTQGVSGHYTYLRYGLDIDPDTSKISLDTKSNNYVGIDIGHNTIDVYLCVNGSILDYGIKGYSKKGLTLVTDKIKEYVFTHMGLVLTDVEAKEVLNLGGLKKRGKLIDLSDKISDFIIDYLQGTINLLEEQYGTQFNKVDNLLIFGGGGEVIRNYIQKSDDVRDRVEELYGDGFLIIPHKYAEYFNTIGYAILSE
jgi:hypothetical protein